MIIIKNTKKYGNITLNKNMIIKQSLTQKDINKLFKLHKKMRKIFYKMIKLNPLNKKDIKKLKKYDKKVNKLDAKIQKTWKFPYNPDYFSYWYKEPYCLCPKIDNDEMIGTKYSVINENCPIHGDKK